MTDRVALIVGAGGVLGDALGREFSAAGYVTFGLRRSSSEAQDEVAGQTRAIKIRHCDLQDAQATQRAVEQIINEAGDIDVLICNSAQLVVAPFLRLTIADFESVWGAAVTSAVASAQATLPGMLERARGTIIFSGATGSLRGAARFAAFSAAKFALRGLAQSLAREYQPHGIHVAHVVLDGLLRGSPSIATFGGRDEVALRPDEVAKTYRLLAEQDGSTWTHEIDLRPVGEKF